MTWSTEAEDAEVSFGTPCQNNVFNDQLALNVVGIYLDNKLQILRKLLLCFAEIQKIDQPKSKQNLSRQMLNFQPQYIMSRSVFNEFEQPLSQTLISGMLYVK